MELPFHIPSCKDISLISDKGKTMEPYVESVNASECYRTIDMAPKDIQKVVYDGETIYLHQ